MALATRCPHCQTTFRVAHDQLKLRAGLVRCGACKEIFNGVEHLLRPDEMQQVLAATKPKTASPQASVGTPVPQNETPSAPQQSADAATATPLSDPSPTGDPQHATTDSAGGEHAFGPDLPAEHGFSLDQTTHPPSAEEASVEPNSADPLQRMTLMDFTGGDTRVAEEASVGHGENSRTDTDFGNTAEHSYAEESDSRDDLSQAIEDLQNKPWRGGKQKKRRGVAEATDSKGKAEPGFMARARRQKRYGKFMRIAMGAGSALLFIALILQSVFVFRDVLAANFPEYRPVLTSLCAQLGCHIKLPAQIDKVSIESSELQSLPSAPSKFTLVALLRNQATVDQAWPYLELTLNDMNEKPVARKVFQPRDYLASTRNAAGFAAQSEQQIKLSFDMLQLKAAGYRLYLFYP